jgi:hypothetical protein
MVLGIVEADGEDAARVRYCCYVGHDGQSQSLMPTGSEGIKS